MLNILEVIFIFYFVMRAFWGLGKFFNQIINFWLLPTPLVTPLATPYIFYLTTLSKILDPPLPIKMPCGVAGIPTRKHGIVKKLISVPPVSAYYQSAEQLEIPCDSSQSGLGADLIHNGQPIAYASRTFTETESL